MIEQNVNNTSNPAGAPAGLPEPAPAGPDTALLQLPAAAGLNGVCNNSAGPKPGGTAGLTATVHAENGAPPPTVAPPATLTTEAVIRGPGLPGAPAAGPGPGAGGFALEDWFATPQGQYVLNWEMARVDQVVADLFGYYAVQVGLPGIDFLRANRITSRLTASLRGSPSVVADAHELPFASESLDLVVLPHLLEFSSEPHQILREVERVLRPEGQVVILCFNPVSLWGVKKLFAAPPHAPWDGEFVSVLRMKDWLKLLNFEMRGGRFGCYRFPYTTEKWLGRFGFLEHAGDRWWPVAGAVYLMQAKKRVPGMRIITPSWRTERRKSEALAPSTNGANRGSQPGAATLAPQPVHHSVAAPKQKPSPETATGKNRA